MKFLNKVLAKKLPKLKLQDSDLGNIGLVLINGKKVTFEEFSKMENLKVKGKIFISPKMKKTFNAGKFKDKVKVFL